MSLIEDQIQDTKTDTETAPAVVPQEGENFADTAAELLEQMALDEPLWIGGPDKQDIENFKAKYPNCQIRVAFTTDESGIIWRTVTRSEWRQFSKDILAIEDDEKKEEYIFSKIILFPDCSTSEAIDNLPAGILPAIMQEFYLHSGFQMVAPSLKL